MNPRCVGLINARIAVLANEANKLGHHLVLCLSNILIFDLSVEGVHLFSG